MLWFVLSTFVFWTVCGVLSKLSREDRAYIDTPVFVISGVVALFIAFALLTGGASAAASGLPPLGAGLVLAGIIPGIFLLAPWLFHVLGLAANTVQHEALGIESMKVQRTYDAAEKLMHDAKYDEAERAFLEEAERELHDPVPLRRAGDAAIAMKRFDVAVGHFRRALERMETAEDRVMLVIRVSEIQQSKLGNVPDARRTLQDLLPGLGTSRTAELIRERLDRLGPVDPVVRREFEAPL